MLRRFLGKERGSLSVETVLWLPLVLFSAGLVFDAATIFHHYPRMARAVQDANRNVSIERFKTDTEGTAEEKAEAYIVAELDGISGDVDAVVDIDASNFIVRSSVTLPSEDLLLIGWFAALLDIDMSVSAAHLIETFKCPVAGAGPCA